jgi:hypothetical protein
MNEAMMPNDGVGKEIVDFLIAKLGIAIGIQKLSVHIEVDCPVRVEIAYIATEPETPHA